MAEWASQGAGDVLNYPLVLDSVMSSMRATVLRLSPPTEKTNQAQSLARLFVGGAEH